MDQQFPPQSRVERLIGSLVMLLAIAVTPLTWSAPPQPARYAWFICAFPAGYRVYPLLLACFTQYWLGKSHDWARTTPTSDSSSPFLTSPIEITEGSTRRYELNLALSYVITHAVHHTEVKLRLGHVGA